MPPTTPIHQRPVPPKIQQVIDIVAANPRCGEYLIPNDALVERAGSGKTTFTREILPQAGYTPPTTPIHQRPVPPKIQQVIDIVAANPGCTKYLVARYVGPHGSLRYGYRTVDRALARGAIRGERHHDGTWSLFPS